MPKLKEKLKNFQYLPNKSSKVIKKNLRQICDENYLKEQKMKLKVFHFILFNCLRAKKVI